MMKIIGPYRRKVNVGRKIFLGRIIRAIGWDVNTRLVCGLDEDGKTIVCKEAGKGFRGNAKIYRGYYLYGSKGTIPFEEGEEIIWWMDRMENTLFLRRPIEEDFDIITEGKDLLYILLGMFGIDEFDENKKYGLKMISTNPPGIHISPIEG